nr:alpha/beta hydrolase domain-containing protein 17B [Ipomoea batatas]
MGCLISQLAAKLAFFPPSPATYQVKTRDDGRVVAVSATSAAPIFGAAIDPSLDVLLLDTKRVLNGSLDRCYVKHALAQERTTKAEAALEGSATSDIYEGIQQLQIYTRKPLANKVTFLSALWDWVLGMIRRVLVAGGDCGCVVA